jgi:hypothetical protein
MTGMSTKNELTPGSDAIQPLLPGELGNLQCVICRQLDSQISHQNG